MNIHENIKKKLDYFIENKSVPNILLYGDSGSGKSGILNYFLKKTYKTQDNIQKLVMFINCNQCKSIKFIREELKFFAKSHIQNSQQNDFKSIVLFNADNLTIDAQSALRRCIELFSNSTRFIVLIENKERILKPILSRFCYIYVSNARVKNKVINLYCYNINKNYESDETLQLNKIRDLITKNMNENKYEELPLLMVSKGYSGLDLIRLLEKKKLEGLKIDEIRILELIIFFTRLVKELRNEKLIIKIQLHFIYRDTKTNVKNLSFI